MSLMYSINVFYLYDISGRKNESSSNGLLLAGIFFFDGSFSWELSYINIAHAFIYDWK